MSEAVSEKTVSVDRLADDTYIVTALSSTYVNGSCSCRTEGEMVAAVLDAIMPYDDGATAKLVRDVAGVAGVSLDELIAERRREGGR